MDALILLAVLFFVVFPVVGWILRLVCRIIGWSLKLVLSIALLPIWIVCLAVGGFALASLALVPLGIVLALILLFVSES